MSTTQVTFEGEMSELKNQLSSMEGSINDWGGRISGIGTAAFASWGATQVFAGIKSGLSEITSMMSEFVGMAAEAAQIDAKLEAVVRATGNAAGFTAGEMADFAMQLREITSVDDDVIKGAETILATFKEIKGDEFKRATAAAVDMAAVLGGDASSAAMQLGKALNDPEKGLTMLAKSGVSFTESQTKAIEAMVKMGDTAGAQNAILKEMEAQFGGAAAAAAGAAGGGFAQLKFLIDDTKEAIGGAMLPVLDKLSVALNEKLKPVLNEIIEGFGDWSSDLGSGEINTFADAVASLTKEFVGLTQSMQSSVLPAFEATLHTLQGVVENISGVDSAARGSFGKAFDSMDDGEFRKFQAEWHRNDSGGLKEFGTQHRMFERFAGNDASGDLFSTQRDDFQFAMQQRQDRINRNVQAQHAVSGLAGGEMEEFKRVMNSIVSFGAQGRLTNDSTTKQTAADPSVAEFMKVFPKVTADLAGLQNLGSTLKSGAGNVLGDTGDFFSAMAKPLEDIFAGVGKTLGNAVGLDDKGKTEEFHAVFESADQAWKRIAASAASGGAGDEKKRQLTAAEGTHEKAAATATGVGSMVGLLIEIKTVLTQNKGGKVAAVFV